MTSIDPTVTAAGAQIAADAVIGPYCVVGPMSIGEGRRPSPMFTSPGIPRSGRAP
jgi:acyl-[acyl carrier protein]--UDP-N-acetylglucosamine O-acyltransferase